MLKFLGTCNTPLEMRFQDLCNNIKTNPKIPKIVVSKTKKKSTVI